MRNGDEMPAIIIEREGGGGSVGSFLLGALLGAGVALLVAPRSGAETQDEIRERARRLRAAAEERLDDLRGEMEERLEQARAEMQEALEAVKERVEAGRESVREAVDSGRHAAREAKDELELRIEQSKAAYRAGVDAAREAARTPRAHGDDDGVLEAGEGGTA